MACSRDAMRPMIERVVNDRGKPRPDFIGKEYWGMGKGNLMTDEEKVAAERERVVARFWIERERITPT